MTEWNVTAVLDPIADVARRSDVRPYDLVAFALRPALNEMSAEALTTIHMPLLNDGTEVYRPVEAMKIGDLGYMVTENIPSDEEWPFQRGHILRCETRPSSIGTILVPVAKAP